MHMTRSENYSSDYCNVFREFDVIMMTQFLIAVVKFLLPLYRLEFDQLPMHDFDVSSENSI